MTNEADAGAPQCSRLGCSSTHLDEGFPFCERCRRAIGDALRELPLLYVELAAALAPSSGAGDERVSGSREAPLPLRAEVMALREDMSGTLADQEDMLRHAEGFTPAGRQVLWMVNLTTSHGDGGPYSTRAVHEGYDRGDAEKATTAFRDYYGPEVAVTLTSSRAAEPLRRDQVNHPDQALQLIHAARFLGTALDKLLTSPAGADAGIEILELQARANVALGLTRGDVALPMPCPNPDCGQPALVRRNGSEFITCDPKRGGCGATFEDVRWLLRVLAVDTPELLLPAGRIATVVGVDKRTVSSWVTRGHLAPAACITSNKRHLYRVGDAMYLASHPTARSRRKDPA